MSRSFRLFSDSAPVNVAGYSARRFSHSTVDRVIDLILGLNRVADVSEVIRLLG